MASNSSSSRLVGGFTLSFFFFFFFFLLASSGTAQAQLSPNFYGKTCPTLSSIVRQGMQQALQKEGRLGASILRLFFHDCFVQGCDGSVLLDGSGGEKNAFPNRNSARGFEVIDTIKASVEAKCPGVVSCADILALATLEGVKQMGGPTWTLGLGRRDSRTSSQSGANSNLPGPASSLSALVSSFAKQGLSATDMTALSGAHTIGQGQCQFFRPRIYNDTNIDPAFAATRKSTCPASGGDTKLAPLDLQTPVRFDNNYYKNLLVKRGLFHSDQELFNGGSQDSLVRTYSTNQAAFFKDFAAAMTKMSNLNPLTGTNGEIRKKCGIVN